MTNGGSGTTSALITLVVVALVVVRFLFRELRERKVRLRSIWIRPGIVALFAVVLIAGAFFVPHVNLSLIALACLIGAVVGVVTGMLVARSTTFKPAGESGAVLAQGSMITVI